MVDGQLHFARIKLPGVHLQDALVRQVHGHHVLRHVSRRGIILPQIGGIPVRRLGVLQNVRGLPQDPQPPA